jgi:hypothetical protein
MARENKAKVLSETEFKQLIVVAKNSSMYVQIFLLVRFKLTLKRNCIFVHQRYLRFQ